MDGLFRKLDGLKLDDLKMNGLKLDGLKLDSLKLDSLKLDGLKLDGFKSEGLIMRWPNLNGHLQLNLFNSNYKKFSRNSTYS